MSFRQSGLTVPCAASAACRSCVSACGVVSCVCVAVLWCIARLACGSLLRLFGFSVARFSCSLCCGFVFVAMVGFASRCVVACSAFGAAAVGDAARVAVLFPNGTGDLDDAFRSVYAHFAGSFDHDMYASKVADFEAGLRRYNQSSVAPAFAEGSSVPHAI